MTLKLPPLFAVALLAAMLSPAVGAQGSDADFLAARGAYLRGDRGRVDALAPGLAGHPLRPYVDFWRLRLRLETATDDEVRAFLDTNPAPPLVAEMRIQWLKLQGKRRQWNAFAVDYPPASGEDTELACLGIQYRWQRDGDAALAAARPLWFTGQATPDACGPLFDALISRGDLTPADRRQRFRLAAQAGNVRLAQSIAVDLPAAYRITEREFAHVDPDPARALARAGFRWKDQGGRELALYALERAARSNAGSVRAAWEKARTRLPEPDRNYGNSRLAYHAARQLHPDANAWFGEAPDVARSDVEHAWRVRAALRAAAWPDVLAAIDAMPPALANESSWRYWRARALAATGRRPEAETVYATLVEEPSFYGLLAAEALGKGAERMQAPRAAAATVDDERLAAFGARADVRRVVKLAELDMRAESQREWVHVVRGTDDDTLLLAAEYVRRQRLYDRAINTADLTKTRHDFGLRYLMPYETEFAAAARDHAVDAALLFGIARQESRFIAGIVSSAGAVGLMQLMPATARWVARELKRGDFRPSGIADPALNTDFGAFYFKYWLDRLDTLPALAAAAYNAGPGRAQAWRNGAPQEGAIWVETIPFNETRDYVKKVLTNAMFYARELNQPWVALTARLGTVRPRDAGAVNGSAASNGVAQD